MKNPITLRNDLHLLKHPFYRAWMEGTLSVASLRDYAQQYFHHVEAFPRYLQNALQFSSSEECKSILAENLAEEDGSRYGDSHPELWLRFAEGVEANRASVKSAKLRSGICQVVETFSKASRASLPQAIGAIYAYESQVPEIAASKIEGLQKNFGIHDARTLAFFEVHKTADVAHREALEKVMMEFTPAERKEAEQAAAAASQALWDFLSDVHQVQAA